MVNNDGTLSPADIIRQLGLRFREYRMRLNLTRKEVAGMMAISETTLYKFEAGRMADMSMATLLKLLRIVGMQQNWDQLLPALPESPFLYNDRKKRQRVRHSKS